MLVRKCKVEIGNVGVDEVEIVGTMGVLLGASLGYSGSMIGIS